MTKFNSTPLIINRPRKSRITQLFPPEGTFQEIVASTLQQAATYMALTNNYSPD